VTPASGLVLLNKPENITSFKALAPVKKALPSSKVGHAGTLDRFARGLLVVLAGSYSRLASYAVAGEKLYRGLIAFGSETDTLDPEGRVVAEAPPPSLAALEEALAQFRGRIRQVPPAYSAVHVGGKRSYELALRGEEPELKEREVEIRELKLLSYDQGKARVEVSCSSGTYIRSLARDIAAACNSRAHVEKLERLAIGPFRVEDAVSPDCFDPALHLRPLSPEEAFLLGLRVLSLGDTRDAGIFSNGGALSAASFAPIDGGGSAIGSESVVFASSGRLLGVIFLAASGPVYKVVLPGGGRP
jgi:tRNA pseudouridine55 synthase